MHGSVWQAWVAVAVWRFEVSQQGSSTLRQQVIMYTVGLLDGSCTANGVAHACDVRSRQTVSLCWVERSGCWVGIYSHAAGLIQSRHSPHSTHLTIKHQTCTISSLPQEVCEMKHAVGPSTPLPSHNPPHNQTSLMHNGQSATGAHACQNAHAVGPNLNCCRKTCTSMHTPQHSCCGTTLGV